MELNNKQPDTTENQPIASTDKAREAFAKRTENLNSFANANTPSGTHDNAYSQDSNSDDLKNQINQANQLDDIVLNESVNIEERDGGKGYVLFGIAIVAVFIIAIIVMKIFSEDVNDSQNLNSNQLQQANEKILNAQTLNNKIKKEQNNLLKEKLEWQTKRSEEEREIAKRLETVNNQKLQQINFNYNKTDIAKDINLDDMERPAVLDTQINKQDDGVNKNDDELNKIFNDINLDNIKSNKIAKEEPNVKPKPIVAKQTKKIDKKDKADKTTIKKSKMSNKFYIQIGSFSKTAGQLLIKKIQRQKKYQYFKYNTTVSQVKYTRVLIGPYKSREVAMQMLPQVKKDFKQPKAYILKL